MHALIPCQLVFLLVALTSCPVTSFRQSKVLLQNSYSSKEFSVNRMSNLGVLRSSIIAEEMLGVFEEVKEAAVPQDIETVVAIALAEGVAGLAGGFLSKKITDLLGYSDQGAYSTSVAASKGVFFGTSELIRGLCMMAGLPEPLDILFASVIAEATRLAVAAGTAAQNIKVNVRKRINSYLNQLENSDVEPSRNTYNVDYSGAFAGVSKWMIYDRLISAAGVGTDNLANAIHFFSFGVIASTCAYFIKQIPKGTKFDFKLADFIQFDVQGGILFLFFEESRSLLTLVVPKSLNIELPFERVIDTIELDFATAMFWNW